jgi:hypothetical protein
MFYVIDNFYHFSSSLYAYRCLPLPRGGDGQDAAAFSRQSRRAPAGEIFRRGRMGGSSAASARISLQKKWTSPREAHSESSRNMRKKENL